MGYLNQTRNRDTGRRHFTLGADYTIEGDLNVTGSLTQDGEAVGGGGGEAGYLVYTALLTQTGTDAPVATVLENTLGGTVVWARSSAGFYTATLTGAFTANKTWAINGRVKADNGEYGHGDIQWSSANTLALTTVDVAVDGAPTFADGLLFGTPVEIRVYP